MAKRVEHNLLKQIGEGRISGAECIWRALQALTVSHAERFEALLKHHSHTHFLLPKGAWPGPPVSLTTFPVGL